MPDTGWHRTSDNPIPLPNGGELQPLRDAGTTSPFCETGSVPIGTPDCATQATLIGIIKPKIVCASMLNQPVGKNSKSHTTKRASRRIGPDGLFKLMSEVISLRERVAQAELAASHSRSLGKPPTATDTAKVSRSNFSRRIAGPNPE